MWKSCLVKGGELWEAGWLRQSSSLVTENVGASWGRVPWHHACSTGALPALPTSSAGLWCPSTVQLLKKAVQSVAVPGACPWGRGQEVARLCWPPGPLPSPDQHHCAGATDSRDLPLRHSIFSGVITAFQANIFLNVTRKLLIPYGKALCIFAGQQTNCC